MTTTTRRKTSTTTGRTAASRNHVPSGSGARAVTGSVDPAELPIRPGEDPWTAAEVAEVHGELNADVQRLKDEIEAAEAALTGLMRDSNDGAGDDQVDAGTKNINRESELSLANNARDMLDQSERALGRLEAGEFGSCESCGQPIGKARLQAFPRATLCVSCKSKQERR
ncbi:TraR/DksA family transcriptional regulator [Kitasatospora humi]|uniref:TraR/DksA family transcriptional regulator n=1 Tax=Kitasatospora humi TaxID=2893891 RepID=UPI0027E06CF4|nr:TraR/DksA family transcriptional regulator [Kitasatospora humi]